MTEAIPLADLEPRRVYEIRSRNLLYGAWDPATRGFIGIRQKFDSLYLFTEYHRDTGSPFGTALALRATHVVVPAEIEMVEYLGTQCEKHKVPMEFIKGDGWKHGEHMEAAPKGCQPVIIPNRELFDLLTHIERAEGVQR